jgi:arsenate reductase (glutaredoxin)
MALATGAASAPVAATHFHRIFAGERPRMRVTIYHNPKCSNSRRCLDIIREEGFEPTIVEYLKFPPDVAALEKLVAKMRVQVRDVVRAKESVYADLGLSKASDAELLKAVAAHPILLNRPIVVTEKGAKLCRPPELVHEILPHLPDRD